ncbi:hypothetical protein H0H92_005778 [Tricholoma furcatifolium]|nr:hypothetical protein H0H92_005778 [Tricholoma furcatifolium]
MSPATVAISIARSGVIHCKWLREAYLDVNRSLESYRTDSLTVFAAIFLFATVFVEGWLSIILYKRYAIIKSKGFNVWEELDYSMPIRVIAYGLYSTIALSLSLLSIKAPNSPVPDLMIATAATVMLFIFATQRAYGLLKARWQLDK